LKYLQCIQLFRKRVQYLSRTFTFIRNASCLNHMNDYNIRDVLRPGTDAVSLNKKKNHTNTITVNFIPSMATHLHVSALVLCYFLNCMTTFLCPICLIHYKDTPCFIKSGVCYFIERYLTPSILILIQYIEGDRLNKIILYFKSNICFNNRFVFHS